MAANINNLIRLHKWNVDEKRRKLAELQSLEDELRRQIRAIEEQMEAEKKTAAENPLEGGIQYANFAAHARERMKNLEGSLEQMSYAISAAREDMAESYRELKKYETVQRNRDRRETEEQNRREQIMLDEIGLSMHRHRNSGNSSRSLRSGKKRA